MEAREGRKWEPSPQCSAEPQFGARHLIPQRRARPQGAGSRPRGRGGRSARAERSGGRRQARGRQENGQGHRAGPRNPPVLSTQPGDPRWRRVDRECASVTGAQHGAAPDLESRWPQQGPLGCACAERGCLCPLQRNGTVSQVPGNAKAGLDVAKAPPSPHIVWLLLLERSGVSFLFRVLMHPAAPQQAHKPTSSAGTRASLPPLSPQSVSAKQAHPSGAEDTGQACCL